MKANERHTCGWKGWMIMTKKSLKNKLFNYDMGFWTKSLDNGCKMLYDFCLCNSHN